MVRSILLSLLALLAMPAQAAGWKLVFQDQFDGATLDRGRWATRYIYDHETSDHFNDEAQVFRDAGNHVLNNGVLSLVARPVGGGRFESGMIRSRQTFYYGYFEARVFLPKGKGIWPAFWLNPDYDADGKLNWPPEIDIFEYVVNGRDDTASMVHSAASNYPADASVDYAYTDPAYTRRIRDYVAKAPLNEGWHVFGLAWAPDKISVFLDGRRLYTRAYRWLRKDGTLGGPAHILLNFSVGGHWAGRYGIDESAFPQALRVDYVRVCQISLGADGGRDCGGSAVTPDPRLFGYRTALNDLPKPVIGAAEVRAKADGAAVTLPITLPAGFKPDRMLKVTLSGAGSGAGKAIASANVPVSGSGKILPRLSLSAGRLPRGSYSLTAELLAGGAPTPLVCAGPEPMAKALSCRIGTLRIGG
ncbi:glycoside hydrolase family 16 protein [Sphingomonas bacterium]|uniref:glycoside hydrolase family 16 protein n=1 Tax=Sphingomonas bacterium TaxID=1895847 RepID=UPI0015771A77|nr:glycoside hydrolase family 16 protein [Sphingomonas bacterium]